MPKINVYLPDDLAEAVKEAGLPVSAICQRALEQAVRRVTAIRETALGDLDLQEPTGALAHFTARTRAALKLAVEQAEAQAGEQSGQQGAAGIGTAQLLGGLLAEGGNLALQVLRALEIEPAQVQRDLSRRTPEQEPAAAGADDGPGPRRLSGPAANALELAVSEATSLGHNYVGCEHLLLGLTSEPDGTGGQVLRALGAEPRLTRRAVSAALAGYVHLRAQTQQPTGGEAAAVPAGAAQALATAVRRELQPLADRIERLEQHLGLDPAS
ncbi:Clp protease N-terminal domain-containing protein [Peterkaempfera griseoplana]|uniref:Clp protease N-terminal domain-containing protein n=1 Tax=Peterkaempfera griseoplana TaxID=66896 RepID=UPI0006E3E0B8|nr:Clp protease N-terminal domain-containing protein [Peterkaempfera griseoplana]